MPTGNRQRQGKGKWVDDPGGAGTAILREIRACATCAARLRAIDRDADLPVSREARALRENDTDPDPAVMRTRCERS